MEPVYLQILGQEMEVHEDSISSGTDQQDHTISIFTSDNGSAGTKISIHRSALLSALTIKMIQTRLGCIW